MSDQESEHEFLSLRNAVRRVGRHKRTLRRGTTEDMKAEALDGAKYIGLDELRSSHRREILANPTRRARVAPA